MFSWERKAWMKTLERVHHHIRVNARYSDEAIDRNFKRICEALCLRRGHSNRRRADYGGKEKCRDEDAENGD